MAITRGFTAKYSDQITLDDEFGSYSPISGTTVPFVSSYILINTPGDLVYIDESVGSSAQAQFINSAPAGFIPIAATKILSSGTVNGIPRLTLPSTVADATWMADKKY